MRSFADLLTSAFRKGWNATSSETMAFYYPSQCLELAKRAVLAYEHSINLRATLQDNNRELFTVAKGVLERVTAAYAKQSAPVDDPPSHLYLCRKTGAFWTLAIGHSPVRCPSCGQQPDPESHDITN